MEMKIALGGGLLLLIIIGVIRRLAGLSTLSEYLCGVCLPCASNLIMLKSESDHGREMQAYT